MYVLPALLVLMVIDTNHKTTSLEFDVVVSAIVDFLCAIRVRKGEYALVRRELGSGVKLDDIGSFHVLHFAVFSECRVDLGSHDWGQVASVAAILLGRGGWNKKGKKTEKRAHQKPSRSRDAEGVSAIYFAHRNGKRSSSPLRYGYSIFLENPLSPIQTLWRQLVVSERAEEL